MHAAMAAWPAPHGSPQPTSPSAAAASAADAGGGGGKAGAQNGPAAAAALQAGGAVASLAAAGAGESWGAMCERVLGVPPLPLWRVVLQPAFAARAKEVWLGAGQQLSRGGQGTGEGCTC